MQIDVVRVRKDEFHRSKRVPCARRLPDTVFTRSDSFQYIRRDALACDQGSVATDHLIIVSAKGIRGSGELRRQLPSRDRRRNLPPGVEDDVLHFGFEYRRAMSQGAADNHFHLKRCSIVLIKAAQFDLPYSMRNRSVHSQNSCSIDRAGDCQAMARLKASDGVCQLTSFRQVSQETQSASHALQPGPFIAFMDRARGHRNFLTAIGLRQTAILLQCIESSAVSRERWVEAV